MEGFRHNRYLTRTTSRIAHQHRGGFPSIVYPTGMFDPQTLVAKVSELGRAVKVDY